MAKFSLHKHPSRFEEAPVPAGRRQCTVAGRGQCGAAKKRWVQEALRGPGRWWPPVQTYSLRRQQESDKKMKNVDHLAYLTQTNLPIFFFFFYISGRMFPLYFLRLTHHVFEAPQHCSSNDAQEEGHDVEDGRRPQQVMEVHHVLAALHVSVFVVASEHLHTAGPVGTTTRGNSWQLSHRSCQFIFFKALLATSLGYLYSGHNERHAETQTKECKGHGTLKTQCCVRSNHSVKKKKKEQVKEKHHEMIINGRYGSRKKGTYFQIMDDFLNFFKTSLFWSPIRGCSLKQRLNVNKYSRSITVNAVAQQNKKDREICQKTWHSSLHQHLHNKSSTLRRTAPNSECQRNSLPAVVEFAAVAGVALHTEVAGGAWRRLTGNLQVQTGFYFLLTLDQLKAKRISTSVPYIALSSRLTGVIITTTGIQGSKVLRSIKQRVFM